MDLESVLEARIDSQNLKLDHLASQMRDLSRSVHSMEETLKNSIEKMKAGFMKHQRTQRNPDVEVTRGINSQGLFQKSLLELDRRMKLLLNRIEDQQESTNLLVERENPPSKFCWKSRDVMVEPKAQIEPKILNQTVKGTGRKRTIELGNLNHSISVSKQSSQLNDLSHRLMVTPTLPPMHQSLTSRNYFIDYCCKESASWGVDKLFDESPRLSQQGKTEYGKFYVGSYTAWDSKPRKPPDYTNFIDVLHVLCGHESLKPLKPSGYNPKFTTTEPFRPNDWSSVLKKVAQVQQSQQLYVVKDLSAADIVMSMMRKENYLIGMLNKGVLAISLCPGVFSVSLIPLESPNGSCSELLQDPEGAYSQLIRLQELNKHSGKQESYGDHEITEALGRNLSQILSQPPFNMSNCSLHLFQIASTTSDFKDPKETEYSYTPSNVSLVHLVYINKPKIPIILGSIAAEINGVLLLILRNLISPIIKSFFKPAHELRNDTEFWALMLLGLGWAGLEVTPFRTYLFGVAGCKLKRRIRLKYFEKGVQMKISWSDKTENSSVLIGADWSTDAVSVKNVRGLVGNSLPLLVQNTVSAISELIIAFMGNWQLAFIVLVLLPLFGLGGYFQLRFLNGFSADTKKKYEEASEVASVVVGSIRTVVSCGAQGEVMKLHEKKCVGSQRAGIKQGPISAAGFGLPLLFLLLKYAFIFYIGVFFVEAGNTTFPIVFQEFMGLSMVAMGVSQSRSFVPNSEKAKTAAASVFGLLDQKSKIDYIDDSWITVENLKGGIEFSHVSIKYPSRPHIQIFRDHCLDIDCGRMVVFVEESGSGKSTVVSLLQMFYGADLGQVLSGKVDIQKLKSKWLGQQMDLVSTVLFNDTGKCFIPSQLLNFRLEDKPGLYGGGIDKEYATSPMSHTQIREAQPNRPSPKVC